MDNQLEKIRLFKSLHIKGTPLVLFNIWDAGSAIAIEKSGAKALATGSFAVAAAHGYKDGEQLHFDLTLANLKRIIASVNLPVSFDLEGGYGVTLSEIQANALKVIEAGAVGLNLEDQIIGSKELYSITDQCSRIQAIRQAAEQASTPIFINAMTDIFFKSDPSTHNETHLEEALRRASAYADSGANGFFAPGLQNIKLIEKLCRLAPIPINIMLFPDALSLQELIEAGVARISYGPAPYLQAMNALEIAGHKVLLINK